MAWKDAFAARKEVILATASKAAIPRAIVVTSLGFSGDKLLIGICQMRKSLENLKENNNVSIVAMKQNEYYMVLGKSEIYSSGEYLDLALERSRKIKPHHVLVIDIKEVFNLDKVKRIL